MDLLTKEKTKTKKKKTRKENDGTNMRMVLQDSSAML